MAGDDETDNAVEATFREVFSRARLEAVDAPTLPEQQAPTPAFEYRVAKAGGGRERVERLNRLGAKGWELVAVDGGKAYLRRVRTGSS